MLKRLAIATFVIACLCAYGGGEQTDKSSQDGKSVPKETPSIVDNSVRHYDQGGGAQKSSEAQTGIEWSNWVLVFIGGITAVAVWKQAAESTKATKAMRDSIRLQQNQMEVTIKKERPYMVVTVEAVGPNEFIFSAKNSGNTPARVASVWCRPVVKRRGEPLKIPPDGETAESLLAHPPQLLPSDSTILLFKWKHAEREHLSMPVHSELHFYGRIRYFNTLEPNPTDAYETRWLYLAIPPDDHTPIPAPGYSEHNSWT
jgi:hypothetical protein